jgi:hypothetical protein
MVKHSQNVHMSVFRAIFVVLLLAVNGQSSASMDEGIAAYNRGDYATALQMLRPLAEQGNTKAQNYLGLMYLKGLGVAQESQEAARWFKKAADQDYAIAQNNLGSMYKYGLGVSQNYTEATKWYSKSAKNGYDKGQYNLGMMHYEGHSVPEGSHINYREAIKWIKKAAVQGNTEALVIMGFSYESAKGVPQNYKEAARWFDKAADQGDIHGQIALGRMYQQGHEGFQKDLIQAYKWYIIAAQSGWDYAIKKRNELAKKLSPSHIAQAEKLAQEWMQRHE